MLSAILLCAMAQVHATVTLDPVPVCPTCNALTARVASLEAQLAVRTVVAEPVRRVRLIEVSPPVVTYSAPLGVALPTLSAWAPGYTTTTVERRGIFGRRMFSAASVCGPGGCP